jgi:micrococcal nuclease
MQPEPYVYHALVIEVHDGDTLKVNVDLGMGVTMTRQIIRLSDVMAPELREERGPAAAEYLRKLVFGQWVLVNTKKKEKYGRWLGVVYASGLNVNAAMNEWIKAGSA